MLMCVWGVVVCAVTCGVLFCVCAARCVCIETSRVYVQNTAVCAFKTSACLAHTGVSEGAHGGVVDVHTGTRTTTLPHTTQHHHRHHHHHHHPHMQIYPPHRQAKNGRDKHRTSGRTEGRHTGMNDRETINEGREIRQRGALLERERESRQRASQRDRGKETTLQTTPAKRGEE